MNISYPFRPFVVSLIVLLFVSVVWLPSAIQAMTYYYVDSDWNGSALGTADAPWKSLTSSSWTTINKSLATDDVTVYFSARKASSDTDAVYDANGDGMQDGIDISRRSDTSSHRLSFNGKQKYNASTAYPSWQPYAGMAMCRVNDFISQNDGHVKKNNITINGFRVIKTGGGKAISICGDNWVVKNSEIYQSGSGTQAPLVLIVPTSDGPHEGSSAWCPQSNNISIKNNIIHDSNGECVYVGGGGLNPGESGSGYPSHNNVLIEGNTIYNCGILGGQGDAIDVKGGFTNLTISSNEIYSIGAGGLVRAIVSQGQIEGGSDQKTIIEKNYIHDIDYIEDASIAIVNSWGVPKGVTIRNNVINNLSRGGGIKVYATQTTGVDILNNTIANTASQGIIASGVIKVLNNILFNTNRGGSQVSLSGTVTSTNNAYSGTWSGNCTNCISGINAGDFEDSAGGILSPSAGSAFVDKGSPIATFSTDHTCISRPQGANWDIGAFEWSSIKRPCPPESLEIAQ